MKRSLLAVAAFSVVALFSSCGETLQFPTTADGGAIQPCFVDADCVPDGCCGRGTSAVHIDDAPDCRGQTCDGTCPADGVDCGCGIPVCRNQRCAVAVTVNDACGG